MRNHSVTLLPALMEEVGRLKPDSIPEDRKVLLRELIEYVQMKVDQGAPLNLQFICTHNARRSHLAQVWAKVAAVYHGVRMKSFSGGTEVTAFNERAVAALQRSGFQISRGEDASKGIATANNQDASVEERAGGRENPIYTVRFANDCQTLSCFSKRFDHPENQASAFAAVMVCSDADEKCPLIPGAEKRIKLPFEDPKAFEGTPEEALKYDERSKQIASELFYVFSKIKQRH